MDPAGPLSDECCCFCPGTGLRRRSITKERKKRKDRGVTAGLFLWPFLYGVPGCPDRGNESAQCIVHRNDGSTPVVNGGTYAGLYGPDRPGYLRFQVYDESVDHCNNNFNSIQLYKIPVTCGLYVSFLQKTGQKTGFFTGFCGKNNGARQKVPKNGDTLKNIVVAQVTVPQKSREGNDGCTGP